MINMPLFRWAGIALHQMPRMRESSGFTPKGEERSAKEFFVPDIKKQKVVKEPIRHFLCLLND